MSAPHIALNRFGLGARPGEARRLDDPRGWLLNQLDGAPPPLVAGAPKVEDSAELIRRFLAVLRTRDQDRIREARQGLQAHRRAEMSALLETRMLSGRPFAERWIAFWSNHLCISSRDGARTAAMVGAYERDVIRAHAFSPFEEMVLASARHPGMLWYLDNARSVGPRSAAARRPARGGGRVDQALRGLNENYARELLELHTVGVEGGYGQADVEQLARIFTGWGIAGVGPSAPGAMGGADVGVSFRFAPLLHEPGRKRVMATTYPEGEEGGVRVIRDLARHPATARFLAGKIATHFIDDAPPPSAVSALERTWLETEGDLREVARTLVELDEAWDPGARKFRTPQDWFVALLRAAEAREVAVNFPLILQQLRHQIWGPPSPKGYGDLRADWADPDALMNRAELARTLSRRAGRGLRARARAASAVPSDSGGPRRRAVDVRPLGTVMDLAPDDPLVGVLADEAIPVDERVALAFAGPDFQWR